GAVTTFLDISARKAAAHELQEARYRLETALTAGEIGTFVWDVVADRVYGDPNFHTLFGISLRGGMAPLGEFVGAIHPEDRDRALSLMRQSLETGADYQTEYRIVSCTPERWVSARGKVVRDAAGQVVRFPGVLVDITARKHAEQARQLSEQELLRGRQELEKALAESQEARLAAEQASRLKDEFLATLGHELRTPLNAILGWAQLLRRRELTEEKTREGFLVIERNARVQVQLIEDLLDMSRIVAGQLRLDVQPVELAEVIRAAVDSVRPAAEAKNICIQVLLDSSSSPVRGDMARLQQIAWNLLSNALKFTPKGGLVTVALERVDSHIEMTVTDSGIGIAHEFLPHVFERFRQSDGSSTRRYQGLGLGLAIVKSLVEMHGGQVRAKSRGLGLGSSFSVELPLMVLNERERSDRTHSTAQASGGDHEFTDHRLLEEVVVLVVDDEKDARDLVRHLLEECGGRVITAGSADEAFELLRKERPQVLLSDVGMPGQDGYSLIRRVRQLSAHEGGDTPAVALTAFARSEDRRKALIAGFQAHVAKPAEPSELVAVIASLAGKIGLSVRDRAARER
ncbi:MAG: sensor hybrid histidine kinase, partial [Myxococcaceae bacterium]|nr:sensor hybrid histidine kinase [Myxococcaceae bacterium]